MKIYVGNLPYSAGRDQIEELFSEYAPIDEIHIVLDRDTNRPRGFAFVTIHDDVRATAAVNSLNGQEVEGRKLVINEARPREERPRVASGGFRNHGPRDRRKNFRRGRF